MKERVLLFDIMKALCVIEIVAFWHMLDYTPLVYTKVPWGEQLTCTTLSAFTFASGFFLGKKQISALSFFESRLKRFMIPLLVSLLVFYFLHLTSLKSVLFAPVGLSCFIGPMPLTLWFFSMIILFYWITPLLLRKVRSMSSVERITHIIIRSVMIYLIMILLGVEERVQMYYFFYILGIIADINVIKAVVNIKPIYQIGGVIVWFSICYNRPSTFVSNLLGIILLLCLSNLLELCSSKKAKSFFFKLSYSSMFAYLFHRMFYVLAKHTLGFPDGTIPAWGLLVTIPIIFLFSYYMQKGYDYIQLRLQKK